MAILLAGEFSAAERERWLALLGAALPGETWVAPGIASAPGDACALADPESIDVAVVANPPPGALRGLPRLGLIQSLWAGVEGLLADPSVPPGVPIARMVDPVMNAAMGETALWAVLNLHRGFFDYAARQRAGRWQPHPQRRADEVPVAVLGLGQMGRTVAARLAANGYPVTGWSARPADDPPVPAHAGDDALPGVLAAAAIVVNLLPLTPRTRGLFDRHRFAQMRPGAALVNLARGGHVVEPDLLDALASGQLGHAVLDVFATEPLPPAHPFWTHPAVTVLPHAAAQTDPRSAAARAAENIRAWREGRPVANRVDRARGY